jgi:ATP-dependent protease ClpP protease subunit
MAKKYDIDIDGFIGSWYLSKRFVKNALSDKTDKEVLCRVNSLGGNLDDAIDIAAQFEAHGNVTCELFALNASAATLFTLGAKKVRSHINSTYLIHKVLSWVDAWGYMNEDDIDAAIEQLKAEKDRNSTQTLVIAKMYAKKTGKPVKDILNLMKQEKWLTAEQAKEWGFVDEIFEDSTIKPADVQDPDFLNLLNVAGLPVPVAQVAKNPGKEEIEATGVAQAILAGIKEFFNPQNKIVSDMNKTYVSINTLLNVEGIEFKNGKVELTEDQVKILNEAITNANAEIKTLNDQIEALNKKPGDETTEVPKETDTPPAETKDEVDVKSIKDMFNFLPD